MSWISYSLANETAGKANVERRRNSFIFKYPCKTATCTNYDVTLSPGLYKFECYGAGISSGTAGAYTSGILRVNGTKTFYFYLGMTGTVHYNDNLEIFNVGFGKIDCSYSGSGATDIRLEGGRWESFDSLKSRIMVAAGSGANECGKGGSGGDIEGIDGSPGTCSYSNYYYSNYGKGAKQNRSDSSTGFFGYSYNFSVSKNVNTGGGDYYGGGTANDGGAGSGGGSSFISGHKECDAITENSTKENIIHTGKPYHYSGIFFHDSIMKNGNQYFFDSKRNLIKGNIGKGVITVTKLNSLFSCKVVRTSSIWFSPITFIFTS